MKGENVHMGDPYYDMKLSFIPLCSAKADAVMCAFFSCSIEHTTKSQCFLSVRVKSCC